MTFKKIDDVILQFLIIDELDKMGVMPMIDPHSAMRNHIDQLPPDDARKLRRKFRKVWRRLVKERCGDHDFLAKAMFGRGVENPSPQIMTERRELVYTAALNAARERREGNK